MKSHVIVRKDSYQDSVLLMRISRELKAREGVEDAVVAMGTPQNRDLLRTQGFGSPDLERAGPNDLILAVRSSNGGPSDIEAAVDLLLKSDTPTGAAQARPVSLLAAVREHPDANLVLISVPGEHAAREARRALALGRHVMLFSDNVSVEDEVELKRQAADMGLLVMGPDCGTAIINGKPLAFANVVRQGQIGIVGASGTGLQEISSLIHRLGGGVSQAIGTGGRDLSDAVGGAMTLLGIEALAADPATTILVVVSKPPSDVVAARIVAALGRTPKRSVVQFVGASARAPEAGKKIVFADTLAGAAEEACRLAGLRVPDTAAVDPAQVDRIARRLPEGTTLKGLFCGGTTGHEALVILTRQGLAIRSNLHKKGDLRVDGTTAVIGHVLLDLGDDVFTQGRPHPMIEPGLRNERLAALMSDPDAGLLLFDVVLGYGSHDDPAGVTVAGFVGARGEARRRGRELVAIGSVTGTPDDPQGYERQRKRLEDAGIVVMADNRRASELAAAVLGKVGSR